MVYLYKTGGELNEALGNLGAGLGSVLGQYNKQWENPFDPFKLNTYLDGIGVSRDSREALTPDQREVVFNLASSYSQKGMSPYDSMRTAWDQFSKAEDNQQGAPSFLQRKAQQADQAVQNLGMGNVDMEGLNGLLSSILGIGGAPSPSSPIQAAISGAQQGMEQKQQGQARNFNDLLANILGVASTSSPLSGLSTPLSAGIKSGMDTDQDEESYVRSILKGGASSKSARAAAALGGEGEKAFRERTDLKSKDWSKQLVNTIANLATDAPLYAVSGALGGLIGSPLGPVGSSAGAGSVGLGLPAMIEEGLTEYMKYIDSGGKATFEGFLEGAAQAGKVGLKEGGKGAIFGALSKIPFNKIPGLEKLATLKGGKAVDKLLKAGTQAGLFTAATGAVEGRIPTLKEYGNTLAVFLGMDLFKNAGAYKQPAYNKLKKSGLGPEEASERIKAVVEDKGYDLNNKKDIVRIVKDITKEPSKSREVFKEKVTIQEEPEITPKQAAKALAERPIEEYIEKDKEKKRKEANLTPKEELKRGMAREEAIYTRKEIDKVKDKIKELRETNDNPDLTPAKKRYTQAALKQKETKLAELTRALEDLDSVARKGRVERRIEDVEKDAEKRLLRLEEDVANPTSDSAKKTRDDFARDRKYVDRQMELMDKGYLPEVGFKDNYIKPLEVYNKAYSSMIKQLNEIKSKADAATLKQINEYESLLKKNRNINSAKIATHKDKLKSLQQLNKPGSAFTRQYLKQYRKDLVDFQKDFIKQKKRINDLDKKVKSLAQDILKDPVARKRLDNAALDGNVDSVSKQTGLPKQEVQELKDKAYTIAEDVIDDVKSGKESQSTKSKWNDSIGKEKDPVKKRIWKGLLAYGLKGLVKQTTGINIPNKALAAAGFAGTTGFYSIYQMAKQAYKLAQNKYYSQKLKNAKNPAEREKIYRDLREKGFGRARRKKL